MHIIMKKKFKNTKKKKKYLSNLSPGQPYGLLRIILEKFQFNMNSPNR